MFALIESCPDSRPGFGWTGKAASLAIHSFLVTLVAAIAHPRAPVPPTLTIDTIVWVDKAPPRVQQTGPSAGGSLSTRSETIMPIVLTTNVPVDIPPPGDPIPLPLDRGSISFSPGFGLGGDSIPGTAPIAGTLLDERAVEERPELLDHPAIRYPEALRQAGVEGRVLVETVVDTLGHAERDRTRVIGSAHPLFDAEALSVVLGARFRPGRVAGHTVRVRVQVPVNFAIR